jgi:hypothetical protein
MTQNAAYPEVVQAGRLGDTVLLDLGCHSESFLRCYHCSPVLKRWLVGTDVRRIVFDSYPAHNILGCDLRDTYITLGHKLFSDKSTCPIHFFTSDIFDVALDVASPAASNIPLKDVTRLEQLRDRLHHVYAGALFHLFDEDTQFAIALRIGVLLRRQAGAVVFGRHQGREQEGMIPDHMKRYVTRLGVVLRCMFTESLEFGMVTRRCHGSACGRQCLSGWKVHSLPRIKSSSMRS